MNLPEIKKDIPIQCIQNLTALYEMCCDEYRRRLCAMWEIPFDESWWVASRVGEGLFLFGCNVPFDMPKLRYIVENNVPKKDWDEWCSFVDSEIFAGRDFPRINFYSWMRGARLEMLKD